MENDTTKWVNVPNCLTILRILLIPLFLIAYYQLPEKRYVALIVFAAASLTDCLDGYLARRLKQITSFGKLCDPLADKIMVLTLLFCLADGGYLVPDSRALNWAILFVMLFKELFLMTGSLFLLKRGTVVQANIWGKSATVAFVVGIVLVFPWHEIFLLRRVGQYVIGVAVALALIAMVSYAAMGAREVLRVKKTKPIDENGRN